MRCALTENTLQVEKGILTRVEKTIPLEKITDLGVVQGPVMRHLGLHALSVETAGQSSQGALVKLPGVVETREFRNAVLRQRDQLVESLSEDKRPEPPVASNAGQSSDELLTDIRDTLHRIEQRLTRTADA
jgi:putative membrane protein